MVFTHDPLDIVEEDEGEIEWPNDPLSTLEDRDTFVREFEEEEERRDRDGNRSTERA